MVNNNSDINLEENKIYIVKDKKVIPVEPPESGYGEQSVIWVNGKVDRVDTKETKKI